MVSMMLIDGETLFAAFKTTNDYVIFTDREWNASWGLSLPCCRKLSALLLSNQAFGVVLQDPKIPVTQWQGVSFAVGASCEDNHADDHLVPEPEFSSKES